MVVAEDSGRAIFGSCAMTKPVSTMEKETVPAASHEVPFEEIEAVACDACGRPVPSGVDREDYAVAGSAVYLWTRGDEVRFERAPLCASCAAAIGMAALAGWEIEEEDG
jgi:hypothetical protein